MNEVLNSVQDMQSAPVEKEAPLQDRVKLETQGTSSPATSSKTNTVGTVNQPVGEPDYASMLTQQLGNTDTRTPGSSRSNFNYDSAKDMSADPTVITQSAAKGNITEEKSWASTTEMEDQYKATDDSDYSWNKLAEQRAQYVYNQEASQVLSDYSKSMQEIKAAGAQAMEDYFAAAYESAQTADKMGWSGGQMDSEATRMKFLQAQQSANMFNKFELQEYGLESQLSVARMYAEAEMESLALEFYQDEVNLALQEADRTGYYIAPEAKEMMKQIQAADKLANDPNATEAQKKRAETVKGAAYAYFDSLGFEKDDKGNYIGVETLAMQEFEETQYMNKVQEQYQKDMLNEAKKQTTAAQTSANAAVRSANANINQQEMNDYYSGLSQYGQLNYNGKVYPSMVMNKNGKYEGITGGNMTTVNGTTYLTVNNKTYVWAPNSSSNGKVPGKWAETSVKVGPGEDVNRSFPTQSSGTDNGDEEEE